MARGLGRWPSIADRLDQKLRERGYWNAEKKRLEKLRFAQERGYDLMSVLGWFKGNTPGYENLLRLAGDLDVTPAWLLFGDSGGRELVKLSTSAPAKKARGRRSRTTKTLGALALLGAAAFAPTIVEATDSGQTAPYRKCRRNRRQLDLFREAA